jgi:hypothetical protein
MALSVVHFSLWTRKSKGAAVSPEAEGTLVRVRSEGEMAAPCCFSILTEKLYDGQGMARQSKWTKTNLLAGRENYLIFSIYWTSTAIIELS